MKQFQGINQASVIEVIGYDRLKHRELKRLYICQTALIMWLDDVIKKECEEAERIELNKTKGSFHSNLKLNTICINLSLFIQYLF